MRTLRRQRRHGNRPREYGSLRGVAINLNHEVSTLHPNRSNGSIQPEFLGVGLAPLACDGADDAFFDLEFDGNATASRFFVLLDH